MKVKLYFGFENSIKKSGIGRALVHQKKALELNNIEYTTDKTDTDYDILHINTVYPDSLIAITDAKLHGKKVIYHGHTTEEDFRDSFKFSNTVSGLYKSWISYLYSLCDVMITPTPYAKKIIDAYDIGKVIYPVSNGVDIDFFNPTQKHIEDFKKQFNISNEHVVVSVGWLFERKGFDTFVEVAKEMPNVKFFWFGDIVLSHPTTKIKHLLKNLPDNVILPGYVSREVLLGAYGYCDCFFFPSREETEGIVVLEALSCKAQLLVRDIPVFDPWLVHEKNCYKANTNDEFISYLNKIINKEIPSTIEEGYNVAYERRLENIGAQLKEIYEEVLK